MARDFDDASSQYLETDSPGLSGPPFTMACWAQHDDTAATHTIMWYGDKDVGNDRHYLSFDTAGRVNAVSVDNAVVGSSVHGTGTSDGVWVHAAGVWASATSRTAYADGTAATEDTTDCSGITGEDRIAICRNADSTPGIYHDGKVAHAAVWDVALTTTEIAQLAKRIPPWLIRPGSLVHYWPLWGRQNPEPDLVGGAGLTVTGATFFEDTVGLLMPMPRRLIEVTAAATGGRKNPFGWPLHGPLAGPIGL